MYKLLDNKAPTKKVSAMIYKEGTEKRALYIATAARENIIIYDGEEIVGGIYTSIKIIESLNIRKEESQVAGDWEDFEWIITDEDTPSDMEIVFDKKARGNANRLKKLDYKELEDINNVKNVSFGQGENLEDFLYEVVPIERLEEENNLDWAKKKNYKILVEDDEIYDFIDKLSKTDDIVGFDTETTGLLVNRTKKDRMVGMSFSLEDHTGVYIPFLQKRFENIKMGKEKFLKLIKPYIMKGNKKAKKLVTHNGGYDWKVLKMYGIELNIVYDTYIRQSLQAIGLSKNIRKLKDIVSYTFGYDTVELEDMYEKRSKTEIGEVAKLVKQGVINVDSITKRKLETAEDQDDLMDFRFASREFVELYGPADGDFPRLLHKEMDKEWDPIMDFIYKVEIELIPVLGEQEYYGVRAVREGFEELYEKASKELLEVENKIYEEAGEVFNINSYPQKSRIIFDKLGCPKKPRYKTKKGNWGTGKDVLEDLAKYKDRDGNQRYPITNYLQRHSKLSKQLSSFYGKLPKLMVDGYIFAQYHQMGTETGRMSNSNPNLQQTEPTSRKYLVPDSDDYYFLICDYSQVEYRIMAGMAKEKKVVDFFKNNAEADYHIMAYSNMMKKPYEEVTAKERGEGKTLNFGTSYGLEDASLAMNLYGDDSSFAQQKAAQARKDYFDGVPNIRDMFTKKQDDAERRGYALTMFNRKREIAEFQGKGKLSDYKRGSGRRKGGNHPVQGTAADILKMAMARLRKFFRDRGYYEDMVRLVMNIHDEVVIQVHKSINPYYATNIVRKAMEIDFSKQGFPPLYIGAIVGYSWFDGQIDELEAPVYLLDEKREEIEKRDDEGKGLPSYDDPRKVWKENIDRYALRTIEEEYHKGYENKETGKNEKIKTNEDKLKNIRLVNYSNHFGSISRAVMEEVIENGHEGIYEELDNIAEYKTETVKKKLKLMKKEIEDNNITTLDEAVKNKKVYDNSFYFGDYCWSVITWLLDEDVEDVFGEIKERMDSDEYEKVEYERPVTEKGKDITEKFETINEYIKKEKIRYNKKNNRIKVVVDFDDVELFKVLDSMLVSITALDLFIEGEEKYNFSLVYENGSEYVVQGYKLFKKFLPLLAAIMKRHVVGQGYFGVERKINELGGTLLKEEYKEGTLEEEELKKTKKNYRKNTSPKGLKRLEKYQSKLG